MSTRSADRYAQAAGLELAVRVMERQIARMRYVFSRYKFEELPGGGWAEFFANTPIRSPSRKVSCPSPSTLHTVPNASYEPEHLPPFPFPTAQPTHHTHDVPTYRRIARTDVSTYRRIARTDVPTYRRIARTDAPAYRRIERTDVSTYRRRRTERAVTCDVQMYRRINHRVAGDVN